MSVSEAAQGMPTAAPGRLVVRAPDDFTEIFVIDSKFSRRASSVGTLDEEMEPGLYKVKYKGGGRIEEQFVQILPGQVREVSGDPLWFSSAAPIAGTLTTHEYHRDPAVALSKAPPLFMGGHADFFLFARWLIEGEESALAESPGAGISLHDLEGTLVLDLSEAGETDLVTGWSGVTAALPDGVYRLRSGSGRSHAEQTLVLRSEWQLKVFVGVTPARADLPQSATAWTILMSRHDKGFDPNDPQIRRTELARSALENHRQSIPARVLNDMLWEKYESPILGLLAALVHTLQPEPDLALLGRVSENLAGLFGPDHPDVASILWWLAVRDPSRKPPEHPVVAPPMARRSWDLLVEAATAYPEAVPAGSLAEAAADRMLGSGAWLRWEVAVESTEDTAPDDSLEDVRRAIRVGVSLAGSSSADWQLRGLQPYLADTLAGLPDRLSEKDENWMWRRLALNLGVPPSTAQRVAKTVATRMKSAPEAEYLE